MRRESPMKRGRELQANSVPRHRHLLNLIFMAAGLTCGVPLLLSAASGLATSTAAASSVSENGSGSNPSMTDALGVHFIDGSSSSLIIERNGKKYLVDLARHAIRETAGPEVSAQTHSGGSLAAAAASSGDTRLGAKIFMEKCSVCHGANGKGITAAGTPDFTSAQVQATLTEDAVINTIKHGKKGTLMPSWEGKLSENEIAAVGSFVKLLASTNASDQQIAASAARETAKVYTPADDYLYSLPTGRRLERHGLYVNFTHRFVFDPAFSGRARGAILAGLDGFSVASFGLRYGVTDKFSVSAYRSPSVIGRPVELMAAYNFLDEHDGNPLNASFRFSVDGQDNFSKNFTTNFEGIFSRTLSRRAQIYFVPALSLQARRLTVSSALELEPPDLPGINTFSLGVGAALDIRPTVAVIAEVIPTLVNGPELGIHRPAYAFGIQKRLWRHAFTLGFSNSPGTVVSQRAGTRAAFLGDPSADKGSGLFIGFDLMRQMY